MKKEIMELLNKEEGNLKIKKLFILTRSTKNAGNLEDDILNISFDSEFGKLNNIHHIKSRDFEGIKQEILDFMNDRMDAYKDLVISEFINGKI